MPEPEAFALHKLIVSGLRDNSEKAQKDLEAAVGLLLFFEDKPGHMTRVREIYAAFPKGWKKKIDAGMKTAASKVSMNL